MRETLYNRVVALPAVPFDTYAADGPVNGLAVNTNYNRQNFRNGLICIVTGTITDGTVAFTLEESADGSTGWVEVEAGRLQGDLPTVSAAESDSSFEIGFLRNPDRPYVRVVGTVSGTPVTGGFWGAVAVLGQPGYHPVERP